MDPELVKPGSGFFVAGRGEVDLEEERHHKALAKVIADNDPEGKLTLGRHKESGEWVLFLRPKANPFGLDAPYPVLGFGQELPSPEHVERVLHETDTRRNGDRILKDIQENNERLRKPSRSRADDATAQLAEAAESFLHAQGRTPYHRSLRKRDPIHRQFATGKD
jgi:hypothetical protein